MTTDDQRLDRRIRGGLLQIIFAELLHEKFNTALPTLLFAFVIATAHANKAPLTPLLQFAYLFSLLIPTSTNLLTNASFGDRKRAQQTPIHIAMRMLMRKVSVTQYRDDYRAFFFLRSWWAA